MITIKYTMYQLVGFTYINHYAYLCFRTRKFIVPQTSSPTLQHLPLPFGQKRILEDGTVPVKNYSFKLTKLKLKQKNIF